MGILWDHLWGLWNIDREFVETDRGERLEVTIQIVLTHKQTAGRAMRERKTCRMNEKHTINRSVKSIMTNLKLNKHNQ